MTRVPRPGDHGGSKSRQSSIDLEGRQRVWHGKFTPGTLAVDSPGGTLGAKSARSYSPSGQIKTPWHGAPFIVKAR